MKKTIGAFLCLIMVSILVYTPAAMAEWNFGIGTGPSLIAIKGDFGFDSELGLVGPVTLDLDLDASDMSDAIDSAFGFVSYATDGKWMIKFSAAQLNLEGDAFGRRPNIWGHVELDITEVEFTVAYPVYQNDGLKLSLVGGVRYIKHDFKRMLHVGAQSEDIEIDNNWTDGLVGLSLDVPFFDNWSWNTGLNAGYGGSDGTYTAKTGVTWRFYKGWSTTLYAEYMAVDFEDSSPGSADWYLYDIDQKFLGLAIMYNW